MPPTTIALPDDIKTRPANTSLLPQALLSYSLLMPVDDAGTPPDIYLSDQLYPCTEAGVALESISSGTTDVVANKDGVGGSTPVPPVITDDTVAPTPPPSKPTPPPVTSTSDAARGPFPLLLITITIAFVGSLVMGQ